jgi:hypothetical protein
MPNTSSRCGQRDRAGGSCLRCHASGSLLDLSGTVAGSGRLASYDNLLIGPPLLDASGRVQTRLDEGVPVVVRGPALVDTAASEGEAIGLARKSRLVEILSGQLLKAGSGARTAHPTPTTLTTAGRLNAAELRLLAEWIDLGGQYANDPFDASGGVRSITGLSKRCSRSRCSRCWWRAAWPATSQWAASPARAAAHGPGLRNRLVLTGDAEGDFNVVLTLVNDACTPAANPLLKQPSTAPHPAAGTAAVLTGGQCRPTSASPTGSRAGAADEARARTVRGLPVHAGRLRRRRSAGQPRRREQPRHHRRPAPVVHLLPGLRAGGARHAAARACGQQHLRGRRLPRQSTGTGGALRLDGTATAVDLTLPPAQIRTSAMYRNFFSAQGVSVIGNPRRQPAAGQAAAGRTCCTAAAWSLPPTARPRAPGVLDRRPMPPGQDEFSSRRPGTAGQRRPLQDRMKAWLILSLLLACRPGRAACSRRSRHAHAGLVRGLRRPAHRARPRLPGVPCRRAWRRGAAAAGPHRLGQAAHGQGVEGWAPRDACRARCRPPAWLPGAVQRWSDLHLRDKLEFGAAWGRFQSQPMLRLGGRLRLSDGIAVEAAIGQVQGLYSGTDFWQVDATVEPMSDLALSPVLALGVGRFSNLPNASLVEQAPPTPTWRTPAWALRWRFGSSATCCTPTGRSTPPCCPSSAAANTAR